MNLNVVVELTSVGTLFAFVLVCGGVLLIPRKEKQAGKFHLPYVNSKIIYPLLIIGTLLVIFMANRDYFNHLFYFDLTPAEVQSALAASESVTPDKAELLNEAVTAKNTLQVSTIIFWLVCLVLAVLAFVKKFISHPTDGINNLLVPAYRNVTFELA